MNADLRVASSVLSEVAGVLSGFGGRVSDACRDLAAGDAQVAGTDPLAGRVSEFAASWCYELTKLAGHAADCEAMLRQAGPAFEGTEARLAAAVRPGSGGG
jgi:hypothetical protein